MKGKREKEQKSNVTFELPLEKLKQEYQERTEEENQKVRKKRVTKADREAISTLTPSFRLLSDTILDFVAARLPNPLPPTDLERHAIAEAGEKVAEKYAPLFISYAPEFALAMAGLGFLIPRLITPKAQKDVSTESHSRSREDGDRKDVPDTAHKKQD